MFDFLKYKKIFISISLILCAVSLFALIFWGLKPGIDFKGGSLMELKFPETSTEDIGEDELAEIKEKLNSLNLGEKIVQLGGKNNVILRLKEIDSQAHQKILEVLSPVEEIKFTNIGPTISEELVSKTWWAIILAVLAIILYVSWSFREISKIFGWTESWRWGLGAIIALAHDLLIIVGFFVFLGLFKNVEIDSYFVTSLLVVLGYSVNDTIVVYDRIRENLLFSGTNNLPSVINQSLNEIIMRSLNTSLTTITVVLAIYLFGGTAIKYFALSLMIGMIIGTWSSLFIATPFLLWGREKRADEILKIKN